MKISNLVPSKALRPYISRYWVWENERVLPTIFSGTGTELMIHYGETITGTDHQENKIVLPQSYIMSPRFEYYHLQQPNHLGFISIRFRAGAFRQFCKFPCSEFIDSFVEIEDLWGKVGIELEMRVREAPGLKERIRIIEAFLLRRLSECGKSEPSIDVAVKTLLYHYRTTRIEDISDSIFLSRRQLERKFQETVGVSPKTFQKIARFEAVMKELMLQQQKHYLAVVLDHGYYDQSHFLKDFEHYLGEAPSSFLQKRNFMSHFYNESFSQ